MVCWLANSYRCYGLYGLSIGEQLQMLWSLWSVEWRTVTDVMVSMVCRLANSYRCYGLYGLSIGEQLQMLWSIWSAYWRTVTDVMVYIVCRLADSYRCLKRGVVFREDLYLHGCHCENLQSHGISNPQGGGWVGGWLGGCVYKGQNVVHISC